ncbi:MAG: MBOAT family protein [Oscillospiraceae bacterium]|nr:MBOAT family protein [Oscillospiraceae bacterium]
MVFSSLEFLFAYLPITLIAYFAVPHKYLKVRNLVLLLVSLAFYGWGEPIYVFLMILSISIEYVCGWGCGKYRDTNKQIAKRFVWASIISNILILGFFKYYDFFIINLRYIPVFSGLKTLGLSLPIGISFYTFQTMSYTLDIYFGQAKVQKNITTFGAYVTLFPQLIAGPIVRYQDVDDMLRKRDENVAFFASGVRTFLAGLGKKIFFANIAGAMWETFKVIPPDQRTVVGCWIGIICYMFQIYFDFSGYSDMAIGLGKMFGFRFLENFNYPYIAKSITDFWRRWHMSLSTWFREYVYFPLGGSRCSPMRNYFNLLVVWFITGFWHGASWNYVIWGLYYAVVLVVEKAFLGNLLKKVPNFVQHIYALFIINIGWLIFVFEDSSAGAVYFGNMFGVGTMAFIDIGNVYDILRNLIFFVILIIACTPYPKKLFYKYYEKFAFARVAAMAGGVCVMLLCVAYLVDSSFNPFLYFRF